MFVDRTSLIDYEWDTEKKVWSRPDIDREALKSFGKRDNVKGFARVVLLLGLLVLLAVASVYLLDFSMALVVISLYMYCFFYGFLVALGHELQHKTVFSKGFDWFSEILFYVVQTLIWNSPTYARISHRLHHRYTMVEGIDPETNWPSVHTSRWVRSMIFAMVSKMFVVGGAVIELVKDIFNQIKRVIGIKDKMMSEFCNKKEIRNIRIESFVILVFHSVVIGLAIYYQVWMALLLITIAWQIGSGFEGIWHNTEHIGRIYNVNDQLLCTRSVKVNPFIKLIYFGLDDHIEHHIYPSVPSCNLPELHKLMEDMQDEPISVMACWKEIFHIALEKDRKPQNEFIPEVVYDKL